MHACMNTVDHIHSRLTIDQLLCAACIIHLFGSNTNQTDQNCDCSIRVLDCFTLTIDI